MIPPADTQFLQIEAAAHEGAHGNNPHALPTEAQHAAGNYKKGRLTWRGLRIAIEQPHGSYRTGRTRDGKHWSTRMAAHYGYFEGIKGADGDELDCFIGFYPQSETVFIINQQVNGRFDEHKAMLAFPDQDSAERAYRDSYERGWNGLHSIVSASISQLKWWLRNGDKSRQISQASLPYEGLETMSTPITWDASAQPQGISAAVLLYEIRRSDAGAGLLMDAVTHFDIMDDADEVIAMDAMVTPYAQVERKLEILRGVMERASATVKPVALQVTDPFKQRGVVNVAGVFELSDGQTISVYLHNPDTTPNKLAPTDELISWKWLLNKKDITIVVAPEQGKDLNVREVARRIMKLAEKNSAPFQRINTKRAERMQAIQGLKDEIAGLEVELKQAQRELEVAKVEAEDQAARKPPKLAGSVATPEINPDAIDTDISAWKRPGDESLSDAVERYVSANLQGRYIQTVIGKVLFNAVSKGELKLGTKANELRAALIPFVPRTLTSGTYQGRESLTKKRSDGFVAFHKFAGEAEVGEYRVRHIVSVGERENGDFVFVAYHSKSEGADSITRDSVSNDKVGRSQVMAAPSGGMVVAMDGAVNPAGDDGWSISIIAVWDANGNPIDLSEPTDLQGADGEQKSEEMASKAEAGSNLKRSRTLPGGDTFTKAEQSRYDLPPRVDEWRVEIVIGSNGRPYMNLSYVNGYGGFVKLNSSAMDYLGNKEHRAVREGMKDFYAVEADIEGVQIPADMFGAPGADAGIAPEGRESKVKTAKGSEVVTGFTAVEADTLITSHDPETGNPNPKFPQELQPRDRGRDTSRAWVIKTAGNLDPEQLGKTRRADTGAPIVGPDGIVESGNGRTMAIVLAYAHGKAGEYRDWLESEADYFGLSADKIKAMRKPVLVRVRTSQIDRAAFAVEANQDDKLAMTATEKARADARRLTDDMIALMTDNGDLTAAANQPFLSAFLRSLGDAEAAQYSTSDGKPTSTLIARVQAAIFAKAYNDDRLLELTADSAKPEIANIISALNFAAPEFIQAAALDTDASDAASKKLVDSIEASLNTQAVNAILGATNVLKQAKEAGMQAEEFVKQQGLFGDIDPAVATMAMFIAKNNRSGKRMGTAFKAMATFIKSEIQRRQTADMFGEPEPIGFEQIVQAANREMDKVFGEGAFAIETEDLFATGNKNPADEPQKAPHAALSEALKRGDLKAALDIIWGQPSPMAASEAVLKAGFSIGSNKTIKEIVNEGAADLTLAAKMKMDGFELRAWKEGQSRPASEFEPQNIIDLEEIFAGLAGTGLVRKRAKDATDAHPQSAAIWNIHNNFSDILAGLESAGVVAVTR